MIHNRCLELEVKRLSTIYELVEQTCQNKAILGQPKTHRHYYIPISPEIRRGIKKQKPRCKNRDKGIYTYPELYKLYGKAQPDRIVERVVKRPTRKGGRPVTQIIKEEK